MTTFLLWDIDGTLLTTGRAGIFAWEDAAMAIIGRKIDLSSFQAAGMTDVEIAGKIIREFDGPTAPEAASRMLKLYEDWLPASLPRRTGRVLPGVREILDFLRDRGDIVSLLLTGNTQAGGIAKLRYYGLDGYFRGGAFSDGLPDRESIARRAAALAGEMIADGQAWSMVVIGDTPHDIRCGKAIGARTLAVASGDFTLGQLQNFDPWHAVEALPPPESFLELIETEKHQCR